MRYIDTSIHNVDQTVAWWMSETASEGLCEFRCQSGYFTLEGSGPLLPLLKDWADQGSRLRLLLGSNRAATLASHISYLAGGIGLHHAHVSLGVVSFESALFHPKVYHFTRKDGSETAYVGSANFTGPGISGLNVEAGIIIDTREGDNASILEDIRKRIDDWFDNGKEGLSLISAPEDIERLLNEGFLSLKAVRPPAEAGLPDDGEERAFGPTRPRRSAIVKLPKIDGGDGGSAHGAELGVADNATTGTDEKVAESASGTGEEAQTQRRFLRHTEASFHYPQGTHLGHILAILWRFATDRQGTPFDDEYIRLSGSLGVGRVAGFRRQIKYKLLAAIEMGLVTDIRYLDDAALYIPELTERGRSLWELIFPHLDTGQLEMGGGGDPSTILPQPPSYYNALIHDACQASQPLNDLYSDTMLNMPAVSQMLNFLAQFPEDRVAKNDIYGGFFSFDDVIDFCNEVGIDPGTEESARHRCPFLLNILESLGRLDQERTHVIRR